MTIDDLKFDRPIIPKNLALCVNNKCAECVMDPIHEVIIAPITGNKEVRWYCGCCNSPLKVYTDEEMDVITGKAKRDHYRKLIEPVIEEVISLYMGVGEDKYIEGLDLSDPDREAFKCMGHMLNDIQGNDNNDGVPHSVSSVARAIKRRLSQLQ